MNKHAVPNAIRPLFGTIKNGGSNPRFYEFDDGIPRIVKWHPSCHGLKVCFNELVASRLGQLIDAPMLRGDVIYISSDILAPDHLAFGREGFHYAAFRMHGGNFVPDIHYPTIHNTSDLPAAAVLLAWLQVADQESHNQYRQETEETDATGAKNTRYLFRLADMGFIFGVGINGNWTSTTLGKKDSYVLPQHLAEKVKADELEPIIQEVLDLPEQDIRSCFDDTPSEWAVSAEDVAAATQWVLDARSKIKMVISKGNSKLQFKSPKE